MPSKTYIYKSFGDNEPIEATVHYDETTTEPRRIALVIHGGGYTMGSKDMIPTAQIDYLVRNGFVVVSIDHRLCPQVSVAEGPLADSRDAYHWCRNKLPSLLKNDIGIDCDATHTVVFGHSSGAHLALLLGTESPPPRAILSFYGPLYLSESWWSKPVAMPVPDFSDDFMNQIFDEPVLTTFAQRGVTRAKDEKSGMDCRTAWVMNKMKTGTLVSTFFAPDLDGLDPTPRFSKDFPPTFFAYGDEDKLVSVDLGKRGYEHLRDLDVDAGIAIAPGGGHGYDTEIKEGDERWKDDVQAGLDFLIAHA